MRKLTMLAGLSVLVMSLAGADGGCGGGGGSSDPDTGGNTGNPDGGAVANYPKTCTADNDCATTEVCHPIGLVCVKNCQNDATVCGAESCVETTFNGKTVSVCKCDTCKTGEVCSADLDDVCETKCTANADCAAFLGQDRICGADGVCKFKPAGACSPACTGGQVCDVNGAIPLCIDACTATSCNVSTQAKCNSTTGLCEACSVDADCSNVGTNYKCDKSGTTPTCVSTATTCNSANLAPGANDGPDTCKYGEVCEIGTNVCSATLPDDTCVTGYNWNPAQLGPVIISVTGESFTGAGVACNGASDRDCCADGNGGFRVDVEFYAPNGMAATGWQAKADSIKFVNPTGTIMSAGHFADYPSANATYSIKALHAGGCGSSTAGVDPTGWSIYLVDSTGAGGNAPCVK